MTTRGRLFVSPVAEGFCQFAHSTSRVWMPEKGCRWREFVDVIELLGLGVIFHGDGQSAGPAGGCQSNEVGGYARKENGGETDGAIESRGCGGGLSGEKWGLGAATMRRAGRGPSVESLVDRDGTTGHGVAVHVSNAHCDQAGSAGCW